MKNIYLCIVFVALCMTIKAQTPPNYTFAISPKVARRFAWTTEQWQGDNSPYRTVRRQITTELKEGKTYTTLAARYKKEFEQKQTDHLKLFAWACALVYKPILTPSDQPDIFDSIYSKQLDELLQALNRSKPPYTLEFMRIRYLSMEQFGVLNDYLTALGERLVEQNKDDFELLYYAWSDIRTNIPGAKEKSLEYARRLIELDPNRPTGYACMAERHYGHWSMYGEHTEDAKQAVHWEQEYLKHEKRVGPRYDRGRKTAQLTIEKLQKWLAKHK